MLNEKRTKETVIADIIQYFKENEDIFSDCVEELDSYKGSIIGGGKPDEIYKQFGEMEVCSFIAANRGQIKIFIK